MFSFFHVLCAKHYGTGPSFCCKVWYLECATKLTTSSVTVITAKLQLEVQTFQGMHLTTFTLGCQWWHNGGWFMLCTDRFWSAFQTFGKNMLPQKGIQQFTTYGSSGLITLSLKEFLFSTLQVCPQYGFISSKCAMLMDSRNFYIYLIVLFLNCCNIDLDAL